MDRYRGVLIGIFFAFFSLIPLASQEKNLLQFVEENGLFLQWEPYREIGMLWHKGKTVSFRVGDPWILADFSVKLTVPAVSRKNGLLLVPKETLEAMKKILVPQDNSETPRIAAIFLDPGHGGKDPGTIGKHQVDGKDLVLAEKDLVLKVSMDLAELLKARYPDKKVILSRTNDLYLTLEERPEMANALPLKENEAVIFISVHANASLNPKAKGFEVWYLPPSYRRNLLNPKTSSDDPKEILPILNTMLEEEFTVESILLAKHILKALDNDVGDQTENRGLKDETWFVVKKAKMPSVLIEIGFVTNPEEAKRLVDSKYLKKLASAIYSGIASFIENFEKSVSKGKT